MTFTFLETGKGVYEKGAIEADFRPSFQFGKGGIAVKLGLLLRNKCPFFSGYWVLM